MSSEYRFVVADTPELRRMPWEKMEAGDLTRTVLWNCTRPTLYDWLELVSPSRTLMGLAFDDGRCGDLAGALWVIPSGLCGTVHFVIFRDWRDDCVRLGREAVRWIFRTWTLEALLAAFPAPYRHLYPFLDALGFALWPERLPLACSMPAKHNPARCVDMALALLRKKVIFGEKAEGDV